MTLFNFYVYFLVLLKTLFILGAVYEFYLKKKGGDKKLIEKIEYWKERCEFVFIVGTAVILITIFTPLRPKIAVIDYETRLLLFMLGWILLITANWSTFFHEAKWFGFIKNIVGSK
jgi:hypothetical protein